ncbi:MAG TPA: asparagine synthase (glutamine-hydrolyzing) [Thermoanaerobaculia bacterium]|jgi:asparagine synthase (glutamine-hydrolysing)
MCGITAFFSYRSTAVAPRREELEAITARMIPRGPDAGGTWISPDGRVGLGSRRLAIIDLSDEGTQPMWDSARELAIVFNGEIYNYAELRASLERGGATFHSRTDTEVLLELYRRDGERMVGLLRGMFAFAIWDTRVRRMFVARDAYGIKPLYIADDGGTIRMASEVKALLAGGAVSRAIDPAGAAGFFLNGSVPEPFTVYKDIRAIEAGTCFFIEEERGPSTLRRHYSIAEVFARAEDRPIVDPGVFIRECIDESVRHHLVSDVPVGLFLSAGVDSSALTQIAARHTSLHTFTLSFHEFSEAPLAERFAREQGTTHTTRTVAAKEFLDDLPRIFERMDQPTIDGVNTWFISKAVHEAGIKVALSGVGGDELFGGYPSFRNVPRIVHHPRIAHLAARARRHPKAGQIPTHARTYGRAYFLQRGLFFPDELPNILGDEVAREGLEQLAWLDRLDAVLDPDPITAFGRVATLEASLYMRNQLLRDADWASMAHSVEVRTPLVDAWLLRQLAPVLLRGDGKSVLASTLPPYLRDRPKTGFFVPMKEWMDLRPDGTSTRMRSWARRVWEEYA